jgi:predicted metal-dependent phosphoesterase TrpH
MADPRTVRPVPSHRTTPHRLNVDLHCHSVVSDGTLAPVEVVERAHRNGVQILALTDHDEVGGLAGAQARARALGLAFVPGVEISVTWSGETIHVVGLRIDYRHPGLVAGLGRTRNGRDDRAREIADQLADVGIPDAYEGALRFAGNPELISRSHFARYIVETGVCEDVHDVFGRYLVEGRPGFVPHRWASLADAVGWIRAAGGTAVMAHPGRYRLSDLCLDQLIIEFRDAGGEAIEVVSGSHTPDQYGEFAQTAQRFGLAASRGSDFHGPGESRHDLGSLPPLPASLRPVWHDWPESVALERR